MAILLREQDGEVIAHAIRKSSDNNLARHPFRPFGHEDSYATKDKTPLIQGGDRNYTNLDSPQIIRQGIVELGLKEEKCSSLCSERQRTTPIRCRGGRSSWPDTISAIKKKGFHYRTG